MTNVNVSSEELLKFYEETMMNIIETQKKTGRYETVKPLHLEVSPGKEQMKQLAQRIADKMGKIFVDFDSLYANENKELFEDVLSSRDKYYVFVNTDARFLYGDISESAFIKCLNQHPGMLFIDDISDVKSNEQLTLLYKLTLEHRAGNYTLHPMTSVIVSDGIDNNKNKSVEVETFKRMIKDKTIKRPSK